MDNMTIPRKIHYCWFGGNPKSEVILRCIESWKKYLPDYEIIEWNESNFDIHVCKYVEQAYERKKWAFVSDYCRIWALNAQGGVYFDTDVEVVREVGSIFSSPCIGFESKKIVNPGLVMICSADCLLKLLQNARAMNYPLQAKIILLSVSLLMLTFPKAIFQWKITELKCIRKSLQ